MNNEKIMGYNEYLGKLGKDITKHIIWLDGALPIESGIPEIQKKLKELQKKLNAEINIALN